jgi:D-alanine-D-alanine ligase
MSQSRARGGGYPAPDLEAALARARDGLRLAVVHGGDKSVPGAVVRQARNLRPWKSYAAVAQAIAETLRRAGFRVVEVLPDDMRMGARLCDAEIDLVWLNTAGVQGRTAIAHAPAMLEMMGIPYVGDEPLNAALLDHKHAMKHALRGLGLPTADYIVWNAGSRPFARDAAPLAEVFGADPFPLIAKPVSGRASILIEVADTPEELDAALARIEDGGSELALIERYLPGAEYCITVAGPTVVRGGRAFRLDGPLTLSPLQRHFEPGERIFTSMDKKPIDGTRFHLLEEPSDAGEIAMLERLARGTFRKLHLGFVARLDIRCDAEGQPMILEANPKPDLTPPKPDGRTALACAGLAQLGMSYEDLLLSLLADRLRRLAAHPRGLGERLLRVLEPAMAMPLAEAVR